MGAATVIICTWNRSIRLGETLESLAKQQGINSDSVEVIIVDNNSNDNTCALVDGKMRDWPLGTLRYEFEPRQGKQFALNRGVLAASHPLLIFTDDDILFPSNWLREIQMLFDDKTIDLAGGRTIATWPDSGRPPWYNDDMQAIIGAVNLGETRLDPPPASYAPSGGNLIARRNLFDRVGMYSESHFRHMDYEFGMRCTATGVRVVYEPSIVVYAPVDESCLTRHYFRRWAFKAGLDRSGGAAAAGKRPRVPLWIYRQCIQDRLTTLIGRAGRCESELFSCELRMWRTWGTIANSWHAWIFKRRHATWIENHSQKKNNLY